VKPVLLIGMTSLTAGLVYFTQVSVGGSYLGDCCRLPPERGWNRFAFVPISIAARRRTGRRGWARIRSDQYSQQIGGALGIAALSTIATSRTSDSLAGGSTQAAALVDGFHGAFAAGAVIAALGVVATLVLIRRDEVEQVEVVEAEPALDLAA
jgi:hypothetical protein